MAAGSGNDDPLRICEVCIADMAIVDTQMVKRFGKKAAAMRSEILKNTLKKCCHHLDLIPEPKVENIRLRAHMACLRGLAMHYVPEHREEAILHLEQAVKLNCTLWKAWVALGDCYYEMGDMEMCRGCMEYALRQGRRKEILRPLAQSYSPYGNEDPEATLLVRLKLAKEAVSLDESDDVLGLSHYLLYLVTYDNAHLVDAKDAYDKVSDKDTPYYSDVFHFNFAQLYNAMGHYQGMYQETRLGFSMNDVDQAGKNKMKSCGDLLVKIYQQFIAGKESLSSASGEAGLQCNHMATAGSTGLDVVPVALLKPGNNAPSVVNLTTRLFLGYFDSLFGCCGVFTDHTGQPLVAIIRNVARDVTLAVGDRVLIKKPTVYVCTVTVDDKEVTFPYIATLMWQVKVNGSALDVSKMALPSVTSGAPPPPDSLPTSVSLLGHHHDSSMILSNGSDGNVYSNVSDDHNVPSSYDTPPLRQS